MVINEYFSKLENNEDTEKLRGLINWVQKSYDNLDLRVKWSQPMFILNETFIIAFHITKKHISVAPESLVLEEFRDELVSLGYEVTKKIFKIKHTQEINHEILDSIIKRSLDVKKDIDRFWL